MCTFPFKHKCEIHASCKIFVYMREWKKTCENNHSPFPFQFPEHDSWHVWLWPFSSRRITWKVKYALCTYFYMLYPYNVDDWYQLATDNACLPNAGLEFLWCLGFLEKLDVTLLSIIWPGVSLIWFFYTFQLIELVLLNTTFAINLWNVAQGYIFKKMELHFYSRCWLSKSAYKCFITCFPRPRIS